MDFAPVSAGAPASGGTSGLISLKILIAGGFGVGKTTFVKSLSEIAPLSTEQQMTALSEGIDHVADVPNKTTTTVAMDFGRITVDDELILYLFGTPGQDRFWFMWDELARGAVGAIVMVDVRRIDDSFPAIDFFEDRRVPFVIALNQFLGAPEVSIDSVRGALAIDPRVPIVAMDARAAKTAMPPLIALVEHAIALSVN
jgi:signal recognition particle receptor subunit beta